MHNKWLCLILIVAGFSSCAPSRFIKPVGKGKVQANASLGGPVVGVFGTHIPVPFINGSAAYGVDSNSNVYAGLNVTSALYGNLQLDLGYTRTLINPKGVRPGFSIAPAVNIISRKFTYFNFYPQLDANLFWNYKNGSPHFWYLGCSNWFEFQKTRAHGQPQENHIIFSPQLGTVLDHNTWSFQFETKLIGPNISNRNIAVEYYSPLGSKGALGIYFSITKKF